MNTLNWWLSWGFDPSNGRVYDTITADWQGQPMDGCNKTGEQTWTYNSGAFLFGLADLFYATGNTKVLDLARTIAYAAMRDFADNETGILTESCEHDPPPGPGKPPGCQQDETVVRFLTPHLRPLEVHRRADACRCSPAHSSKASSSSASQNSTSRGRIPTSTTLSTRSSLATRSTTSTIRGCLGCGGAGRCVRTFSRPSRSRHAGSRSAEGSVALAELAR